MNTDNIKYKATERFSFGWTDPRGVFGSKEKGVTVTIRLGQFTLTEKYQLNTAFGATLDLDVSAEQIANVERLALHDLENMWSAAYGGEVALKEVAASEFMSAVFLRLARAGLIEADPELSCVQLKESNANSPEQSAVAAY